MPTASRLTQKECPNNAEGEGGAADKARLTRLTARITDRTEEKRARRETAEQILADHKGHPRSICRHPNDDPVHGFWTTVFSVLMEPEKGLMWVSRGNPCSCPFECYQLG